MAPQLPPIIDADWLRASLADVVVCDVRWYLDGRSGREAYEAGHLPGARFVDLDDILAGPASAEGGRHPLPSPERFARGLGALGVGHEDAVVAYDDTGGMVAGRLVWMLRVLGQEAALLDGGLDAWPGPRSTEVPQPEAALRRPLPWPDDALATADDVARHLAAGGVVLDARAPERYRGESEPIDPRAGHIPGARNAPHGQNLVGGRFASSDQLHDRFRALGADGDAVVYCGSGVSACHDVLAMEHAGLGRPRLFVGSWSAWSADPERPAATGPHP